MAMFFYRALGKSGSMVEGELEGLDDKSVALQLQNMGMMPLHVDTKQKTRLWNFEIPWRFGSIRAKELMFFTQELSTLVNAGLPLDRSLAVCKELSDRERLQSMVDEILQEIKQGKSLADSLASHPKVFS